MCFGIFLKAKVYAECICHHAWCFQIIQAFSRLVAAGGAWDIATAVVEATATALQSGSKSVTHSAQVSAIPTAVALLIFLLPLGQQCTVQSHHILLMHKLAADLRFDLWALMQAIDVISPNTLCCVTRCLLQTALQQASQLGKTLSNCIILLQP